MTPVDSFLHSVRGAFAPSWGATWLWGVFAAAVAVAALGLRWRGRWLRGRADATAFASFVADKRLSGEQTRRLVELAARAGDAPLAVATSLDLFERATALALAGETPTAASGMPRSPDNPGPDDVFTRVRQLRHALGFHVVPDHLPLVTTRELVPGTHVAVGAAPGEVFEVNEAWFAVIAPAGEPFAAPPPGAAVPISFTRDARYVARCHALGAEPPLAPRKLLFRHDERPERHQLRAAVRVNAHGTARLAFRPAGAEPSPDEPPPVAVELIDISVGGMAVTSPRALRPGLPMHAAITWDGEAYSELPVAVLHCDQKLGGRFLVRLEFRGLPAPAEARLAAAVARHSARPDDREAGG